jgi:hypothetical protein
MIDFTRPAIRTRPGRWISTYERGCEYRYRRVVKDGETFLVRLGCCVNFTAHVLHRSGETYQVFSDIRNRRGALAENWKTINKLVDEKLVAFGYELEA